MPSLIAIDGNAPGKVFPLAERIVSFGRDDTCTYQILDALVSRKHLQIRLDPKTNQHIAGDYRSANGVFVNGVLITLDAHLHDGDSIRIGQTTLIYFAQDPPDPTTALDAARKKGEWRRSTIMRRE